MPSREASLRNLEKARAAWSHPPRPWRSFKESCVIQQLVWQWFNSREPRKWSGRVVARWLGVSHTYVQKLVQTFQADPDRMLRIQARSGPATFEQLNRAREFTRQDSERGYLRTPRRFKLAEIKIGSNIVRAIVPTKAEERRRAAEAGGCPLGPTYVPVHLLPLWARGLPYFSQQNPCDPLIAIKHALRQNHGWRPTRSIRGRWRPGRPWFG